MQGIPKVFGIPQSDYLFLLFPKGFSYLSKYCFKLSCIIPIGLQKFSLSLKRYENFDAEQLLEAPFNL